jgi:hypothetical protein
MKPISLTEFGTNKRILVNPEAIATCGISQVHHFASVMPKQKVDLDAIGNEYTTINLISGEKVNVVENLSAIECILEDNLFGLKVVQLVKIVEK